MGVLEQMRSSSDSTFMQVVLALVVVAFIGVYARQSGPKVGVAAIVDGHRIMDSDVNRAYSNIRAFEQAQQNRTLTDAEEKQLWERTKQDLIQQRVLLQEAARIGIEVSDAEVASRLMEQFGRDGKFSREEYEKFVKRRQYTRDMYEARLREELVLQKLASMASFAAHLSDAELERTYVERATKVDLKMVEVRPQAFESQVEVSDEDRTAWIEANPDQIKEVYDRDFDRLYNHPEQVRLSMIRLAISPDGPPLANLVPMLNDLREQLEDGAEFADLAKRWSEDPSALNGGDLGLRAVKQLSTREQEEIATLEIGSLSKVISTDSDVRIVRLEERVAPTVDAQETVQDEIALDLMRAERVKVRALEFAENELLPAWKEAGEPPQELLGSVGLTVNSTGPIPTQRAGFNPFAPPQILLDAARVAEVGTVLPEVYEQGGVQYVAQVVSREDPDMEMFELDRERIYEQALQARRSQFLQNWADYLKAQATIE